MNWMKNILVLGCLLLMVVIQVGCATVVNGTTQEVTVDTKPSGAIVMVDELMTHTPVTLKLSRKKDHVITLMMMGYKPAKVHIKRGFNPVSLGNIGVAAATGGIGGVGGLVDWATGSSRTLNPSDIYVVMDLDDDSGEAVVWDAESLEEAAKKREEQEEAAQDQETHV
ncbi:PEGA domain-containing protein [Planctomycetota bacterium]|nr:PEGA domain-containing protein [Planctomycetota bacterium]